MTPARVAARVRGVGLALAAMVGVAAGGPARAASLGLGAPALDPSGAVRWAARPDSSPGWAGGLTLARATRADSVLLLERMVAQPRLRMAAYHRLGALWLASGDTARADSCWAQAAGARSLWAWAAMRGRASLALARGDALGAEEILGSSEREGWPDADRAAWLALRVRLRVALADTTRAIQLARQALRVYPSAAATASVLDTLDGLLVARGDSLAASEERAAAEAEIYRGDRLAAARRLRRALPRLAGAERSAAAVRLAEVLRGARRFGAADEAAQAALAAAPDDGARARALLERARVARDGGRVDDALSGYAAAAAAAPDSATRDVAWWESGRAAEDAERWPVALASFARGAAAGGRRARDAALRAGLMQFVAGRPDSACAWWAGDSSDAACFWWGVGMRAQRRSAAGDSALRQVARRPGYAFHRVAARESLGVRGWPGGAVAEDSCAGGSAGCDALGDARALLALGLDDDASLVLSRWTAGDVRVGRVGPGADPGGWLAGARLAYAAGRTGLGIVLADRALREAAERPAEEQWTIVPWAYPPAFEELFVASSDPATGAIEPALLFAVTSQESRFDPRARSASDALGLMQLKLSTAADVARWAHERAPAESTLFDPALNVRYGARYLGRLLERTGGSVAVALSAYNAGPGSLPAGWRDLLARGGEALFCEIASNAAAQDYARKILGFRQAYRELRPTAATR